VADNGQPLRGPYTSSEWGDPAPYEEIAKMKDMGFNALHLYAECFDINYPNAGSTAPGYSASRIDAVVQATRELGMYLVMTIGNGANNGNYNNAYVQDFWKFYAPRYADEKHVLFEIQNEPVGWSPPYSTAANGALNMEIEAYNTIRSYAPDSPVLLFSYSVMWGAGAGNDALGDIHLFNQAVFGDQNAEWTNLAVAFHGYAGAQNTVDAVTTLAQAGYPAVMTEYHGMMWGAAKGGFDVEFTYQLEKLGVSWLSFVFVPPWGVSDSVSRPDVYLEPMTKTGLSWRPDFGTFPAVRGTHGHDGLPWETPAYSNGKLSGTLHIEAEDFDEGGKGVAYDNAKTATGSPYRSADTVSIATTSDTGGGYHVAGNTTGEWLEYTLRVPGPGLYNLGLRVSGAGSVRIQSRDQDAAGVVSLPGGGWSTVTQQVSLPGGLQRLRLSVESGTFDLNWLELSPITAGPIADGTHNLRHVSSGQRLNLDGSNNVVTSGNGLGWTFTHSGAAEYTVGANNNYWTTFMGPLHLTPSWGAENVIFEPQGNGNYRILHAGSGLCFIPSTDAAPKLGTAVCDGSAGQLWAIE